MKEQFLAKNSKLTDLVQPGHIFPLMAKDGGVLVRAGHTEAGCDLAKIAGLEPSAVIVEILKEDGSMARKKDLLAFAKKYKLKIGTIEDLIKYKKENEKTIKRNSHHNNTNELNIEYISKTTAQSKIYSYEFNEDYNLNKSSDDELKVFVKTIRGDVKEWEEKGWKENRMKYELL